MISLHHVLLATDFSDCSRAAQAYACELVEQFGGELHVLHVLPDPILMMPEKLILEGSFLMLLMRLTRSSTGTSLDALW